MPNKTEKFNSKIGRNRRWQPGSRGEGSEERVNEILKGADIGEEEEMSKQKKE